ncbi:hypothetical protein C2S53_003278 [Perilla frutescens var. hirtella]|uniref:Uncharacterized protein n=1 Tax=Perilla frutescens var. hirtella TaxID=608512 RepID=A0AAD4ITE3_PERFH|nr:hypothetical protein C2S53_003278 [Perilla frutescens var. hirtella]
MKTTRKVCLSTLVAGLLCFQIFSTFAIRIEKLNDEDIAMQKYSQEVGDDRVVDSNEELDMDRIMDYPPTGPNPRHDPPPPRLTT